MKCPICGKELELMKKQVGSDENGRPIFNQYAVCRNCKKQWNLDKQRAKKKAAAKAPETKEKTAAQKEAFATKPIVKREETENKVAVKAAEPKRRPVNSQSEETVSRKPSVNVQEDVSGKRTVKKAPPKKRPETAGKPERTEEQKYGNIPSERVRAKKEKAVREAYEDMLSTDPNYKPKKRNASEEQRPKPEKKRPNTKEEKLYEERYDDDYDEEFDYMDEEPNAKYRVLRVILGILSVLAFGYFGYKGFISGLDSIASGGGITGGFVYIILAACMLVAGLILLIMQNSRSIFAYLIPIVIYLGGGVFAFLKRGDEQNLLYSAIAGAVLALILIILAATSRNQEDEYEYDDEYEDDDYE